VKLADYKPSCSDRDEIENERGPPEVTSAFAIAGAGVVELTDTASVDHRDRPLDDASCDIGASVRGEVPNTDTSSRDPRGPAPGGLRSPSRIERPLAGGDARNRVRKPEFPSR